MESESNGRTVLLKCATLKKSGASATIAAAKERDGSAPNDRTNGRVESAAMGRSKDRVSGIGIEWPYRVIEVGHVEEEWRISNTPRCRVPYCTFPSSFTAAAAAAAAANTTSSIHTGISAIITLHTRRCRGPYSAFPSSSTSAAAAATKTSRDTSSRSIPVILLLLYTDYDYDYRDCLVLKQQQHVYDISIITTTATTIRRHRTEWEAEISSSSSSSPAALLLRSCCSSNASEASSVASFRHRYRSPSHECPPFFDDDDVDDDDDDDDGGDNVNNNEETTTSVVASCYNAVPSTDHEICLKNDRRARNSFRNQENGRIIASTQTIVTLTKIGVRVGYFASG